MTRLWFLAVFAVAGLAACTPTPPAATMSVADATALCTKRATSFAQTPLLRPDANGNIQVGLQAETPDSFMVGDYYRSCMYAKAGVRLRLSDVPDIPVYN